MAHATSAPSSMTFRHALPWAGLVVGLLAVLPPYTRDLNTSMRVEVADHVVPGALMIALCGVVIVRSRRNACEIGSIPVVAGVVILLAGLWMTSTHLPFVNQARRNQNDVSNLDAAWHTVPGVVVLVLGLVWTVAWSSANADEAASSPSGTKARA